MNKEIHQSQLNMLFKCGIQYEFRYIKGIVRPPNSAMVVGTGVHVTADKSFTEKFEGRDLPALDEIKDLARDTVANKFDGQGIMFTTDEAADGPGKVKAAIIDQAVALAALHREAVAPILAPIIKPEKDFRLAFPDSDWKIGGVIDLYAADASGKKWLRDLKTSRATPGARTIADSLQMTLYALALSTETKQQEIAVAMDFLVKNKTPKYVEQQGTRGPDDYKRLFNRMRAAFKAIESGTFMPALPGVWWCSPLWCGYWDLCEYRSQN